MDESASDANTGSAMLFGKRVCPSSPEDIGRPTISRFSAVAVLDIFRPVRRTLRRASMAAGTPRLERPAEKGSAARHSPSPAVDRWCGYALAGTGSAAAGSPPPIGSLFRLLNRIAAPRTTSDTPAIA
jgi:hypothetical protein